MKKIIVLVTIYLLPLGLYAQNTKQQDQKAIKSMCGCYEVGFNFAETFSYSQDSSYLPSPVKHDTALEWIMLLEDEEDVIVLQHLLIVGRPSQPHIIKHWRQDWIFENIDMYMYYADYHWKFMYKSKDEVRGQWTQKVFQVDDSPRYEGSASWVHVDGRSYWENTTDAPLPRREYTQRQDYNVTVRSNRHEITENGWIHDQDNNKVIRRKGAQDVILAQEKGYNTYKRVDASRCKAAQDWWKEHKVFWKRVREHWGIIFSRKEDLTLTLSVEDKALHEHLFTLKPNTKEKTIQSIINNFVQ